MSSNDSFMFIIKARFEERKRSLLGFLIIIGDSSKQRVYKCVALVKYFTEKFYQKIDMLGTWEDFLDLLQVEQEKVNELFLTDFTKKLETQFEAYSLERVDRLVGIIGDDANIELKAVLLNELLMEDLTTIFPASDLSVEILSEVAFNKSKKKKSRSALPEREDVSGETPIGDQTDDVKKEEEQAEQERVEDPGDAGPETEADDHKKELSEPVETEAEEDETDGTQEEKVADSEQEEEQPDEPPDTGNTVKPDEPAWPDEAAEPDSEEKEEEVSAASQVELVVDPVDGLAAGELRINDTVIASRASGFKSSARVVSIGR
ncbi:MAG: hypothetical protein QGH40_04460, partial [bacterium]|nr:hypothetical protein [bacterium]